MNRHSIFYMRAMRRGLNRRRETSGDQPGCPDAELLRDGPPSLADRHALTDLSNKICTQVHTRAPKRTSKRLSPRSAVCPTPPNVDQFYQMVALGTSDGYTATLWWMCLHASLYSRSVCERLRMQSTNLTKAVVKWC